MSIERSRNRCVVHNSTYSRSHELKIHRFSCTTISCEWHTHTSVALLAFIEDFRIESICIEYDLWEAHLYGWVHNHHFKCQPVGPYRAPHCLLFVFLRLSNSTFGKPRQQSEEDDRVEESFFSLWFVPKHLVVYIHYAIDCRRTEEQEERSFRPIRYGNLWNKRMKRSHRLCRFSDSHMTPRLNRKMLNVERIARGAHKVKWVDNHRAFTIQLRIFWWIPNPVQMCVCMCVWNGMAQFRHVKINAQFNVENWSNAHCAVSCVRELVLLSQIRRILRIFVINVWQSSSNKWMGNTFVIRE